MITAQFDTAYLAIEKLWPTRKMTKGRNFSRSVDHVAMLKKVFMLIKDDRSWLA